MRTAVTEFNASYPTLLEEHRAAAKHFKLEYAARRERAEEDQKVIDRLTAPYFNALVAVENEQETDWGKLTLKTIKAGDSLDERASVRVELVRGRHHEGLLRGERGA